MERKFVDLDRAERITLRSMLRNPKTESQLQEWLEDLDRQENETGTDPFLFMVILTLVLFGIIFIFVPFLT